MMHNIGLSLQRNCYESKVNKTNVVLIGEFHDQIKNIQQTKELTEAIKVLKNNRISAHVCLEAIDDKAVMSRILSSQDQNKLSMVDRVTRVFLKSTFAKQKSANISFAAIDIRDVIPFLSGIGDILFWFQKVKSKPSDFDSILKSFFDQVERPSDGVKTIQDLVLQYMVDKKKTSKISLAFKQLTKSRVKILEAYGNVFKQILDDSYLRNYISIKDKYMSTGYDSLKKEEKSALHSILRFIHNYAFDMVAQGMLLHSLSVDCDYFIMISGLTHAENLHDFITFAQKEHLLK